MSVEEKVLCVCTDILGFDAKLDSNLIQDLGADSLDCVEIGMALEKEFGIDISDEDMFQNWGTVQEVVDYIKGRIS